MPKPIKIVTLDEQELLKATRHLAKIDSDLAAIVQQYGPPPLWAREPGFNTLVHIILEQQVSLASAKAAHTRLVAATNPLTPERFLLLDDAALKGIGFSRQKTGYARGLAMAMLQGRLDVDALQHLSDDEVRTRLSQIKGIGRWSSDIYLLMALLRADIFPQGDLALVIAVQQVKRLPERPTNEQLEQMSVRWQPYRAVAARLFWHHYLSTRANE